MGRNPKYTVCRSINNQCTGLLLLFTKILITSVPEYGFCSRTFLPVSFKFIQQLFRKTVGRLAEAALTRGLQSPSGLSLYLFLWTVLSASQMRGGAAPFPAVHPVNIKKPSFCMFGMERRGWKPRLLSYCCRHRHIRLHQAFLQSPHCQVRLKNTFHLFSSLFFYRHTAPERRRLLFTFTEL